MKSIFKLIIVFIIKLIIAFLYPLQLQAQDIEYFQKLVSSDRSIDDNFGNNVAISGDYAIFGVRNESEDVSGGNTISSAGSAYIFERIAGTWTQVQKIVASDRAANDFFGTTVAISGNYIVVGAFQEDEDSSGSNTLSSAGSAYVFERIAGTWTQVQKIVASDRAADDFFGLFMDISDNYIAVSAFQEDEDRNDANTLSSAGSVYIFERTGGTWSQVQKITPVDRDANDFFGRSVAISGESLVIGAFQEDEDGSDSNTLSAAGSAYVFNRTGGTWSEVQKIVPTDRAANDLFGTTVDISGDYIIVGTSNEDEDASGGNTISGAGSAYIFEGISGTWVEAQKVVANNRAIDDFFGAAVAISGDQILIGASHEDENATESSTLTDAGSAYAYELQYNITYNAGVWQGGSGASGEPTASDLGKSMAILNGSVSLNPTTSLSLSRLLISDGASLILDPNASLSLSQASIISNTEGLVLSSDATGTANLIDVGLYYKNSGSVKVERYLSSGSIYTEQYHYIGSPINNHAKFTDMEDLYGYRESDLMWLHHTDGVDGFNNFTNGKGYAIRYTTETTKDFVGAINTGNYTVSVTATDHSGDVYEAMNLLANPYPSSISAAALLANNHTVIGNNLYFWNGQDFSVYNTSLATGTAGGMGVAPDDNIAVGQAFFVEALISDDVSFTNTMRGSDSDIFFKQLASPQLRLVVSGASTQSDLLLTENMMSSYGIDAFDAKHLPGNSPLSLHVLLENKAYDIETVPSFENQTFHLLLSADEETSIDFHIKDMISLKGKHVYLEDKKHGTITDITNNTYGTRISSGDHSDRFNLRITTKEQPDQISIVNGIVKVLYNNKEINGTVRLLSMDGKLIETSQTKELQQWNGLAKGIYIIDFSNDIHHFVKKVTNH